MSIKLLIADDEAIEYRALTMQIQRAFPELVLLKPANNGIELLETARRDRPDIIIADIEMPGMNGLQALEQLQAEGIRPQVIIMTAYGSEHYLKESISLRVFEYLEKPMRRQRVEEVVALVISEVEKAQMRDAEMARMRDSLDALKEVIRSELMVTIESDEANTAQTAQYLDMLNVSSTRYVVMTLCFSFPNQQSESVLSRNVHELRTFENLKSKLQSRGWICGHVINHRLSCLVPVSLEAQNDDDYRLRQWACCEADEVLKLVDVSQGLRIGIGSSTAKPENLQRSRQQSVQALYNQDQKAQICHYEDQPLQGGFGNPFMAERVALAEAMRSGSVAQMEALIGRCLETAPEWMKLKPLCNAVFDTLMQLNRSCQLTTDDSWSFDISEKLNHCENREALQKCFVVSAGIASKAVEKRMTAGGRMFWRRRRHTLMQTIARIFPSNAWRRLWESVVSI